MNINQELEKVESAKISKISYFKSATEEEKIKRNEALTTGLLTLYTYMNLNGKGQDLNSSINDAIKKVGENKELTMYLVSFSIREILNVSRSALSKCKDIIKSGTIDFLNLGNDLSLSRGM